MNGILNESAFVIKKEFIKQLIYKIDSIFDQLS